jgi:predicted ribosome quality control (RQC) complex YloA/Tae2 family protein
MAELSAIEVMVLVNEINARLSGMYVNNVYSLGENQILRLRNEREEKWLILSLSVGAWISEKIGEREKTTEFTSRLRNFVNRKKFSHVEQVDFDRVYMFSFQNSEEVRIYLEVPPPGNIVITDEKNRIKLCLRNYITSSRNIREGSTYIPPVQKRKEPSHLTRDEFINLVEKEKELGAAIGKNIALPRKYVSVALKRLGLRHDQSAASIKGKEEDILNELKNIIKEARDNPYPVMAEIEGKKDLFCVFIDKNAPKRSVSEICDELFLPALLPENEEEKKRKEIEHTIQELEEEARKVDLEAKRLREIATKLLTLSTKDEAEMLLRDEGLKAEGENPASISSFLFDRAKKLEEKKKQIEKTINKMRAKLATVSLEVKKSPIPLRRKTKEWYEKFRWFVTSEGKLAIGGRDATTNSIIIRRYLEQRDTVYHADIHGSPFFILKDGVNQTEKEILEVAQATACYSSAWKTGLGSADAFWVNSEQIKLSAPSGQYLPRGSFLITGKKNYVRHVLLQLAVGINSETKVTAGPETAIMNWAEKYVVIEPYKTKNSEVAKRIASFFNENSIDARVSVDDILVCLPAGGSRIVRRKVIRD